MARRINLDKYGAGIFKRTEMYAAQVSKQFESAVERLLKLTRSVELGEGELFTFSYNNRIGREANAILRDLYANVYQQIKNGATMEWEYANMSADALIRSIFGKVAENDHFARYFLRNQEAMDAFFERKTAGLNLSQRVWNCTGQLKDEMELALSVAMGKGESASTISRQVRQYLQEPDKLFRRVRDEKGNLKLSKAAAAYHPGQGVYRSSYKNAMRLTRTETNMAYRSADHERWKRMDFVIGIEIHTSGNHPDEDICDELAGVYPKDFKFVGWHPQCRCFATPLLADDQDMMDWSEKVMRGEAGINDFKPQQITELPDNFTKWMEANADRIENAAHKPYFLTDNEDVINRTTEIHIEQDKTPVFEKLELPQLPDFVPDFSKMSYEEKVNNMADAIIALDPDTYKRYAELAKRAAELGDAEMVWKGRFNADLYTSPDSIRRLETINHLKELATADLSVIPQQWHGKMAELISQINAHDIATNGFKAIYAECEHAYNIYKLSTTQEAIDYGLAKLSDRTPYNLFTVVRKKIPNFAIPEKEFMDRFDKFVPLSTRAKSGSGAYYQPFYGNVCIPVELRKYATRLKASKWYAEGGIFHHEFGHALDWQIGIKTDQKLVTIYDAFKADIQKKGTAEFEKVINDILDKRTNELGEAWRNSKEYAKLNGAVNNAKTMDEWDKAFNARRKGREKFFTAHGYDDLEEMLGAFSDCLGAATDGTCTQRPRGHFGGYFKSKENQLAEFVAHCSENYWSGNPYFEKLAPQLYKAMRDYFAGLY